MTAITGVRADIISALIGEGDPASDSLIKSLADSVRDRREHEHPTWEDLFCSNLTAWAGERMGPVLRRLVAAESQLARLTEQSDLWHCGELDTTTAMAGVHAELHGTPLPPVGQWDRDQAQRDKCPTPHRRMACGCCPHDLCQDCNNCAHTCSCANPTD